MAAFLAALISRGTALNFRAGMKPDRGEEDWTASGASRSSSVEAGMAAFTASRLRPRKSRWRKAKCSGPNTKSFVVSVPSWRLASGNLRPFKSVTNSAGHLVSSESISSGDQPPQNSDRPPTTKARPGNQTLPVQGVLLAGLISSSRKFWPRLISSPAGRF